MSKKPKFEDEPAFVDELVSNLRRVAPRDADGASGSVEVTRSDEQVLSEIKYVLTTGVRAFDDLVGGFPFGRITELYGLESCGKTAMVIRASIRAQLCKISACSRESNGTLVMAPLDPEACDVAVLYIDNEQSIDDDQKLIVDGNEARVALTRADTVDQMFKYIDKALQTADARQQRLDARGYNKTCFTFIVVDTVAATSSKQELEQEWGKEDYPRQANQISRAFRRLVREINRRNACLICTNQVRDNIRDAGLIARRPRLLNPQDSDYTTFGGKALKYYASHRVFMFKLQTKYRLLPSAQFAAGWLVGFTSIKNRIRKPLREGRMALLFDEVIGGLNDTFSLLETLIFLGFVEVVNKEKGTNFKFKFIANAVPTTTFSDDETSTTLAEDDELPAAQRRSRVRGKKDPVMRYRAEWPEFYEAHKVDVDALWAAAIHYAFVTEGLNGNFVDQEAAEEEGERHAD